MTDLVPWLSAHAMVGSLVLARTTGLSWTAPVLAMPGLGARMRLILAVGLALLVAPAVAAEGASATGSESMPLLVRACLVEGLVGAMLGWTASLVVAGARQAGDIVAGQAGLSSVALFDPEAGEEVTALGHLYGLVALGLFLALDGPLVLVQALVESYRTIPPGGPSVSDSVAAVTWAFARVDDALALAVRAAAPVAVGLTMAGAALGLLGRAAPSFQRSALMLPVRSTLALVLVLIGLSTAAVSFLQAWQAWPVEWPGLVPAGG